MKILVRIKGGPGSGNFSRTHFGRPGMRGGSVAVGSGFETDTIANLHTYVDKKFAGREDLHTAVRHYDRGILTEEELITTLGMTPKQYKMRIEGKYASDAEAEVRTEKLEREFYTAFVASPKLVDAYIQTIQDIEGAGHTIEHYEQELDKSLRDPDLLENTPPSHTSALHNSPIAPIVNITDSADSWIRNLKDVYDSQEIGIEVSNRTLNLAGVERTPVYRKVMEDTFPVADAREYLKTNPDSNFPIPEQWRHNITKAYQSLPKNNQQQFIKDLARISRNLYELDAIEKYIPGGTSAVTAGSINTGVFHRAYEYATRNSGVDYLGKNHGSLRDQFMKAAIAFSKGKTLPEVSASLRS